MQLDNVDVLLGMTIGCIILGIGLSLFFTQSYTGYGAVVMAIGMMTLSLMITARPRVIERVKRENMLQPVKQMALAPAANPPANPPANIVTSEVNEPAPTPTENRNESPQENEAPPIEPAPAQPQTQENQENAPEQKTEPVAVAPSA